jgi:hypothetical protein
LPTNALLQEHGQEVDNQLSEVENPVDTLLRLISTRIRVTKDNGDAAKLLTSEAAYDRELLLKEYDAQITLQVDPVLGVQDQKLELAGRLRRQMHFLKCTVHTIDKLAPGADSGRVMRNKVTEQVKAIIRENRTLPYQTIYNFAGVGYPRVIHTRRMLQVPLQIWRRPLWVGLSFQLSSTRAYGTVTMSVTQRVWASTISVL